MATKTASKNATAKGSATKMAKSSAKTAGKKALPAKTQKKAAKVALKPKAEPKKETKTDGTKTPAKKGATKKSTTSPAAPEIQASQAAPKINPVEKLAADEAEFSMPATKPPKVKKKSKRQLAAEEELDQMGKKWAALLKKTEKMDIKPSPYNMRKSYDARTPIEHKILGWGYILANKNDRLEVLFKDGIKFLISNYKG